MKSPVVKRSIVIAGHKTSVSLEDAFWKGLKEIADDRDVTLSDLVSSIDTDRQHGNLSSAIRLFVLDHYRNPRTPPRQPAVDARPDRDAGGVVSSARRVAAAAGRRRVPARPVSASAARRAAGARLRRGAASRPAAAVAGAGALLSVPFGASGAAAAGCAFGTADGAAAAAFGGFGAAAAAAAAASRAARSIASICLDCCSTARSVSQLVSRLVSMVRSGAGSGPLSATITRRLHSAWHRRRRIERQQRIEHRVGEIDIDGRLQLGAVRPDRDVAQARLPGVDADGGGCLRHRQAGVVERAGDEFADAAALGRNAKLDGAGHRAEHIRIEADKPRLFERDGAEAGQRADERRRAAADAFDLGLERETARRRRPLGAREDRAEFGAGRGRREAAP